jgi:hypothetical protein
MNLGRIDLSCNLDCMLHFRRMDRGIQSVPGVMGDGDGFRVVLDDIETEGRPNASLSKICMSLVRPVTMFSVRAECEAFPGPPTRNVAPFS